MLDIIFSNFRWYRKFVGGHWFLVAPWPSLSEVDPKWIRGKPLKWERVFDTEVFK